MALYLVIERPDGIEERIPMINREETQIESHVVSAEIEKVAITSRSDLDERRYRGVDIQEVIRNLAKGDEVIVKTAPKSYKDQTLTITKDVTDEIVAENSAGSEFYILRRYWGKNRQGHGNPWLRNEDWDSRGRIEEIEITSLNE